MKICTKCKINKPLSDYYNRKIASDGKKSCCAECSKKQKNKWRESKKDHIAKYMEDWRERNKDHVQSYSESYTRENREKVLLSKRKSGMKRYNRIKSTPEFKVSALARSLVKRAIRGSTKVKGTEKILGYSFDKFRENIESKFSDGMSWCNHGEWHLDHIIPLKQFELLGIDDQKIINALSNLRPIWASDNYAKSDKFELVEQYNERR